MQTLFFILLATALLVWINHLRSRITHLREVNRQSQNEQAAVLRLIDKLGEKITSKIDLDETLEIIMQFIVETTEAESGAIFLINDDQKSLSARVVLGPFPPLHATHDYVFTKQKYLVEKLKKDKIPFGDGIIGLVAEQGEPLLISDAESDPRVSRELTRSIKLHSIILCPLRVRGKILGVFVVVNKQHTSIFNSHDMALLQVLADQAAVTVDLVKLYDVLASQQRIEQELKIAHEFQRMLLPERFPEVQGIECCATSEAALVVGGDYFDFFMVDDTHLGVVIADVSGKGVPGALIMAMVRSVLRAEARGQLSPLHVMRRVNERIVEDTKENVFITATYAILDTMTQKFRFVRCGHEPTLIIDPKQSAIQEVAPEGIALGLISGDVFDHCEEAEVQLREGQTVMLYTDGVIEAMDRSSQEYGRERMLERVRQFDQHDVSEQIDHLIEDINKFTTGIPQHDDITVVALRVTASAEANGSDVKAQQTA